MQWYIYTPKYILRSMQQQLKQQISSLTVINRYTTPAIPERPGPRERSRPSAGERRLPGDERTKERKKKKMLRPSNHRR